MSRPTDFIRRLLQLRVFLIVNLVILFFLSLSFGREWVRNASIESQIHDLQEEKESLEARNVELLSLGATIQTQYYLEKEGRLKYGLRRPGEELVVVTDSQTAQPREIESTDSTDVPSSPSTSASAEALSMEVGNPRRWWDYFFHKSAYQSLKQQYGE